MKNLSKKFGAMLVLFVAVALVLPVVLSCLEGYEGSFIQKLLKELED